MEHRPDPDELLKSIEAEEPSRGRLKIFLGYAAGVGKTYAMLEAAHQRKKQGVDVVVGHIDTHGRAETEAMRALGVKRFVGVTYFKENLNQIFTRYFTEAGFEVSAMEGIDVAFNDVGRLSGEEIYAHTKKAFLKHPDAQAIYMLGSGWRLLKIVRLLEQDLQVPVIYALACKLWDVQKQFHVREPVKGYGRLSSRQTRKFQISGSAFRVDQKRELSLSAQLGCGSRLSGIPYLAGIQATY
jgi:maleate cis-trans isomerase